MSTICPISSNCWWPGKIGCKVHPKTNRATHSHTNVTVHSDVARPGLRMFKPFVNKPSLSPARIGIGICICESMFIWMKQSCSLQLGADLSCSFLSDRLENLLRRASHFPVRAFKLHTSSTAHKWSDGNASSCRLSRESRNSNLDSAHASKLCGNLLKRNRLRSCQSVWGSCFSRTFSMDSSRSCNEIHMSSFQTG